MLNRVWILCAALALSASQPSAAQERGTTTLANPSINYTRPGKPYVQLRRSGVEAIIVDNSAVDDAMLNGHRAGYSGIAVLRHARRPANLFVPAYAGLNFEHILDGTAHTGRELQFEPRNHPMELRLINRHTVELYQPPTFHHALESCQRFELLSDGTIELTIELIARKPSFKNGYINLFWASYIHQPESLDIHFRGVPSANDQLRTQREIASRQSPSPRGAGTPAIRAETHLDAVPGFGPDAWIRGVTPAHGELSTHISTSDARQFPHDEPFPLTLVHSLSNHRFTEPWYFGVSHGMAFVQMFRPCDQVRITQSPSGGGKGNPAWDFQFYVTGYEPGRLYRFVMRAAYLPYESHEQVERATRKHRAALAR